MYLLDFFNSVYKMHDNTRAVDIVYSDFQKASDTASHKHLISTS